MNTVYVRVVISGDLESYYSKYVHKIIAFAKVPSPVHLFILMSFYVGSIRLNCSFL
jgi:hypothetical protein